MFPASKFEQMKSEVKDVIDIFTDDIANSEQTIELITEVAGVAIATQGLSEVPESEDKAKIVALMVGEIGMGELRKLLIDETT